MKTIALILAAGRENQMRSERAKELHQSLASMLDTTAETLRPLAERTIVVLGHHAQELSPALPDWCGAACRTLHSVLVRPRLSWRHSL